MRITKKTAALLQRLRQGEGAWVSIHALSEALGEPRQNLNYGLTLLMEHAVIERCGMLRPAHYRLVAHPEGTEAHNRAKALVEAAEQFR